jgi:predicted small secreted protein
MLASIAFRSGLAMRHSLLVALVALAALGVSACAGTPGAAKPTEVADAGQNKSELVCHEEIPTGTHIRRPVRVCATQEEWDRRREADQKAIRDGARRGGVKTGG